VAVGRSTAYRFVGCNGVLFVIEQDMHADCLDAWRVPAVPSGSPEP
jgi:hypothetical protein